MPVAVKRGAGDAGSVSLRKRLHAWWEGYELPASLDGGAARRDKAASGATAGGTVEALVADTPPTAENPWPELRRKLAQIVWGPGFNVPGGGDFANSLVQSFGLSPEHSIVDIGAGMGGGTRAIALEFGTYVTGLELDKDLAKEGTLQAGVHDLEDKAPVHHLDLGEMKLRQGFFNGAILHETLFKVPEKEALLQTVIESLKPNSQIMISDLFIAKDAVSGDAYEAWTAQEATPVHLWTPDALADYLSDNNVDVRICKDETEEYCGMILRGWDDFVGQISVTPLSKNLVVPMVREVELWAKRLAALQSGDLVNYRINGIVKTRIK